eukprot:m.132093 g.132093  ORF g.132093 m.132093 type:complete len:514 (-) comp15767_c2_seq1:507-2048(-)
MSTSSGLDQDALMDTSDEEQYDMEEEEEDDDDAFFCASEEAEDDIHQEQEVDCKTGEQLIKEQLTLISEISTMFEVPSGTARVLLQYYGWNKDRLVERLIESDRSAIYAEAGCVDPAHAKEQIDGDMCSICGNDDKADLFQLGCGHPFCRGCWIDYLTEKIKSHGKQSIQCPEFGCNILVDEYTVTSLLGKPEYKEILDKYYERVADAIVNSKPTMRWCPRPGCTYAVIVPTSSIRDVKCKCGYEFCFQCGQDKHTPVLCGMLQSWLKKCADDSETSNWLQVNTKLCPKCEAVIEKNGGCNHMKCRKCNYDFCWICLGDWEPHGSSWFTCSRFNDEEAEQARKKMEGSRAQLNRYLFYFERFKGHQSSREMEGKLWKAVDQKMKEMQSKGWGWMDVQFLGQAVGTLQNARRVLQYTYVFAYYLKKNAQSEIFEQNQADLQVQTEKLSEFLEQHAAAVEDFRELRQQVMDLRAYCAQRLEKLVAHVEEGYREGFWSYADVIAETMVQQVAEFNA